MAKKKETKVKPLTLTIRVTDKDEIILFEKFKKQMNKKTYSQAILRGIGLYFDISNTVYSQNFELTRLKRRNEAIEIALNHHKLATKMFSEL